MTEKWDGERWRAKGVTEGDWDERRGMWASKSDRGGYKDFHRRRDGGRKGFKRKDISR